MKLPVSLPDRQLCAIPPGYAPRLPLSRGRAWQVAAEHQRAMKLRRKDICVLRAFDRRGFPFRLFYH